MNQGPFDYSDGKNYILTSGAGIGPINTVAPLLFNLDYAGVISLDEALKKIFKHYKLEQWRMRGKIGRNWGTSQKEFKTHATEIVELFDPPLRVFDQKVYDKYEEKVYSRSINARRAYNALNPLALRAEAFLEKDLEENSGCYCLLNFYNGETTAYVGQAKDIRKRLKEHKKRSFKLYSFINVKKEDLDQLECALFHFVNQKYRVNEKHPPIKGGACEFCTLGLEY